MMKIAIASDGGNTVAKHIAHCQEFLIFEVNGQSAQLTERRPNPVLAAEQAMVEAQAAAAEPECCQNGQGAQQRAGQAGQGHGHGGMLAPALAGCEAVIARGMGAGFWQQMQQRGVRPFIVKEADPQKAAEALAAGSLESMQPHACCGGHH